MSESNNVTLNRLGFDASPDTVALWLKALTRELQQKDVWLLLELSYDWMFVGPSSVDVANAIDEESVGKYGLRGRLFWDDGQVEWRRWEDGQVRVVALTEDRVLAAPEGLADKGNGARPLSVSHKGTQLILWGKAEGDGLFREGRVSGPEPIDYPLELSARTSKNTARPVLKGRRYFDNDEIEIGWRFCGADVRIEGGRK